MDITCTKCELSLPQSSFNRDSTKSDGYRHECKACRRKVSSASYFAHREESLEASKRWNRENPESGRAASAKFREANPGHVREYARNYRILNPEVRNACNARRRTSSLVAMSGEDRALSVAYRKAIANDLCSYCGVLREAMHVDHVVPLALGGTDHWWNLTRACATCNWAKHSRTPEQWMEAASVVNHNKP